MLGKGLQLLVALGNHPDGATLTRLATDLGLPISTTHRLLNAMVPPAFVELDSERRLYSLGLTIFQLSHRVALVQTLSELALPVMRRLTQVSGEQTLMSVLQGTEIVYLERVEGQHQIQNHAEVGQRGAVHSSSMGKSLIAFLPEAERERLITQLRLERRGPNTITDRGRLREELELTRQRGYAVNEEENEAGIRSIGVPVIGPRGRPVCAICLTAPVFRCSREQLDSYVPLLKDLVREIEARLPRGGAPTDGETNSGRKPRPPKRSGPRSRLEGGAKA
jgi:DNA-binding IclR family transcriptional regulator